MKKKKKDVAALLMEKRATYTDNLRQLERTFTIGYVENAGKGDWAVYPTRHSNGIFIPSTIISELLQFGEVKRECCLGDGDIYIETWKLE